MSVSGPAFGNLRLAVPEDILRIGIVAAAGFRYSPLFRWERPHHTEYPADTLLSYREQFKNAIANEEIIVLVAEDEYQPEENSKTEAIIPNDNGWTPPAAGEKCVVGVASIRLEPGSGRKGYYQPDGVYPDLPSNPGRDLNRKHYDEWGSMVGATRKEYCDGDSLMAMLVVHPAYWRRGHGTELVKWAVELSRLDKVKQCVSAAGMGYKVYLNQGFETVVKVVAQGDDDDPEGCFTHLMEFLSEYMAGAIYGGNPSPRINRYIDEKGVPPLGRDSDKYKTLNPPIL